MSVNSGVDYLLKEGLNIVGLAALARVLYRQQGKPLKIDIHE